MTNYKEERIVMRNFIYIICVILYTISLLDFITLSHVQFLKFDFNFNYIYISCSSSYLFNIDFAHLFAHLFSMYLLSTCSLHLLSSHLLSLQCMYLLFSYIFINAVTIHIQYCLHCSSYCIQHFVFNCYI